MNSTHKNEDKTPPVKPLGELLVEKGLISPEQLQEALTLQRQSKNLLGEIIVSRGWVKPVFLYQTIAEQTDLAYAGSELMQLIEQVDRSLVKRFSPEQMNRFVFFPLKIEQERVEIVTAFPNNPALDSLLHEHFPGYRVEKKLVTPYEVDWLINYFFKEVILSEATTGLMYRHSEESAARVFTRAQTTGFSLGAVCILLVAYASPYYAFLLLFTVFNLFYLLNILFKFVLSLSGAGRKTGEIITDAEIKSLQTNKLPVYTILLPLYKEPSSVIHQLTRSIHHLDYPPEKLDVIYLIEEDDKKTLEDCRAESPPYTVRFLVVPQGLPKTKPRACNFGLAFARGEFLTIFDAEDMPEPSQLKKAVIAFRRHSSNYACFQAALNYYNQNQNLLTRLFTLEYSYWFDFMLPGLFALNLPIPLGGTSNHFRTAVLRELGGWDPFNVTEDADLGMRASYRGYKIGVFNSTTYEEANSQITNWIRQRSRWLKGYLQTFLVHNRRPLHVVSTSGWKGWFTLQFFIGGTTIGQAASLILWGVFAFWLVTRAGILEKYIPAPILYMGTFNLFFGNFLGMYLSMLAVFRRKYYHLTAYALLNPLYWLMASIAAWKAIYQLFSRPFYWEKTEHGLHQGGIRR